MKISKKAKSEAKGLFRACLRDGIPDEGRVREMLSAVMKTKPRGYLPVLVYFHYLLRIENRRRTARIESAVALSEKQTSDLKENLTSQYGKGLIFEFKQNDDLLGGVRIQVGSDVLDGSIRGRLGELESKF